MRRLHGRLALNFGIMASVVLIIASIIIAVEIHYHLQMADMPEEMESVFYHLERAMIESLIWTVLGAVILVLLISSIVARRFSKPLISMRKVSEQMAGGKWDARIQTEGKDEIRDLGESINFLARSLQKQELARQHMTADIAHELRTPLATLKSHMEAFEDGIWEPTPARLRSCTEEIDRLINLVQDLEELNRLDSPDFQLTLTDTELQVMTGQVVEAVRSSFHRQKVGLTFDKKGPVHLKADQDRLKQVVLNLLMNALQYTDAGGAVSVYVETSGQEAILTVSDTGIGMSPEDQANVFDRLYRADPSRSRNSGGNGLGLAIAKRLVEAHGGRIELESEVGIGTTVFVKLPL
ncbi:HAMP domain-containing protein [Halobacillus fulvus]|nr:HAMP domain-containing protein [Halobacillus fulvus]